MMWRSSDGVSVPMLSLSKTESASRPTSRCPQSRSTRPTSGTSASSDTAPEPPGSALATTSFRSSSFMGHSASVRRNVGTKSTGSSSRPMKGGFVTYIWKTSWISPFISSVTYSAIASSGAELPT